MTIIEDIQRIISMLLPYAQTLIVFFVPIYIIIGEVFSKAGMWFVDLTGGNMIVSYIIMGVFIILGLVFGIIMDPKRKQKKENS